MGRLRILVVDDHPAIRKGVRALLCLQADWLVCGEAEDGISALDKARELRPDIVVMDITMPRMNGIEAGRTLSLELPESEVVLISQNDPVIGNRHAADAGAAAFIAKSDLAKDLNPTIARIVARRRN